LNTRILPEPIIGVDIWPESIQKKAGFRLIWHVDSLAPVSYILVSCRKNAARRNRGGTDMNLAKRIRDYRYAKGWGPDELASRAEISRTALYQIESGKTELPRAGTLRRIARALEVPIDVLLGNAEVASWDLPAFPSPVAEPAPRRRGHTPAPAWSADEEAFARAADDEPTEAAYASSSWSAPARERDLTRKLHDLLESPLGEGVARIVEESHRMLPAMGGKRLG
jgi:transcriptional regulator with XRE-family HTH domain